MTASTCALPADGGRCRGNFERWAFNGATGDCEPFTYGGCGGNGNRFMCKEMCERHCARDGQSTTKQFCGLTSEASRRHRVARATFTQQGVSGTIDFCQRGPSDAVWTCINLSGLGGKAGMFHVHEFPVKDNKCSSTGGHYNPFNVAFGQHKQDHRMHEVGDLSGKHGGLEGKDEVIKCYRDTNLSLLGKNSIIDRSVVIHKNPGGDRWVCADIKLVQAGPF